MDNQLADIVLVRLEAEPLGGRPEGLVLAALEGASELVSALGSVEPPTRPAVEQRRQSELTPLGIFLRSIEVAGFRGIGPAVTLEVEPGPGLTIVTGRNGSGKSSIAEALEIVLSGENQRWRDRKGPWREGWRNMHDGATPTIEIDFAVEGSPSPVVVKGRWKADAGVDAIEIDAPATTLGSEDLSWRDAVERFRPVLSYNELATFFDEPGNLYRALNTALGIEAVDEFTARLTKQRLALQASAKAFRETAKAWHARLEKSDDPRAEPLSTALDGRKPDPDEVARLLAAQGEAQAAEPTDALDMLGRLHRLDLDDCTVRLKTFRAALARRAALSGGDADAASQTAKLLAQALRIHGATHREDCLVCGAADQLDPSWVERTNVRVAELEAAAEAVRLADGELRIAREAVRQLAPVVPERILAEAAESGLELDELATASRHWAGLRDVEDDRLAAEADAELAELAVACETTSVAARLALTERDAEWLNLRSELEAWLAEPTTSLGLLADERDVKAAEKWALDAGAEIRRERLRPLVDAAMRNWERLRHGSSVEIASIALEGAGNRRHVDFDVTVDGAPAPAFGVMSQGEIHALALAVFLPRAMAEESPFRFIVIDDPVQSMDPAKVDGLARVLEETARERQVVVLTHDTRLVEAVQRLGIPAVVQAVTRREGSRVSVTVQHDPVVQALDDARSMLRDPKLPREVAGKVVPTFCRTAIEGAAARVTRRRRLARGERHLDVDQLISSCRTTLSVLALAYYDDESRGGDVLPAMNNRLKGTDRRDADTVSGCNRGSHNGEIAELESLVAATGRLTDKILALT